MALYFVALLAAIVTMVISREAVAGRIYRDGVAAMLEGRYADAVACFDRLNGYGDEEELARWCVDAMGRDLGTSPAGEAGDRG